MAAAFLLGAFVALAIAAAPTAASADNTSLSPPLHQPPQAMVPEHGVEKRYVAALARNGDLPLSVRREWHKKMHPAVSAHRAMQVPMNPGPYSMGVPGKRYPIATPGQDPSQQAQNLILLQELEAAEHLQDAEQQLQMLEDEKRSLSSLARGGMLPGKRFDVIEDDEELQGEWKRGISTLAKNGQLPASLLPSADDDTSAAGGDADNEGEGSPDEKRGGVAALARLGHLPPHKRALDWLLGRLQGPHPKRNVGSLARDYALPRPGSGKRNLGSLARGGGFSALRYAGSKKSDAFDAIGREEQKRSAASLARNGLLTPIGKRYLGALMRSRSFDGSALGGSKRNIGSLARNWYLPSQMKAGKRDDGDNGFYYLDEPEVAREAEEEPEEVNKRYVAALLRQGRLPVGLHSSNSYGFSRGGRREDEDEEEDEDSEDLAEDKRHLGSLRRFGRSPSARPKRDLSSPSYLSEEYPVPVFQNPDSTDYEDALDLMTAGLGPEKRFLGRIPQMSRPKSRPTTQLTQLRRGRPRSRNI